LSQSRKSPMKSKAGADYVLLLYCEARAGSLFPLGSLILRKERPFGRHRILSDHVATDFMTLGGFNCRLAVFLFAVNNRPTHAGERCLILKSDAVISSFDPQLAPEIFQINGMRRVSHLSV